MAGIRDYTIVDSAVYKNPAHQAMANRIDSTIHTGIVRSVNTTPKDGVRYMVEVMVRGNALLVSCDLMCRFGGVHNYEEYTLRPYKANASTLPDDPDPYMAYEVRTGDHVLVASIGGQFRSGVILGGLPHPSRKPRYVAGDIAYAYQFNGVETVITKDGEYRITNRGQELVSLDAAIPGSPILASQGDPTAGNYLSMMPNGDLVISDNGQQIIKIEKTSQTTTITSGQSSITIGTSEQKLSVDNLTTEINSTKNFKLDTAETALTSTTSCKIKGLKLALGNDTIELVDAFLQLIDLVGAVVVTSPVGPCNPLQTAPQWTQVTALQTKVKTLKTSL